MQISLSKLMMVVTWIAAIGFVGIFGYFMYGAFFTGESTNEFPTIESVRPANFGPKFQSAAAALVDPDNKIKLGQKDIAFTESALFKSFTDVPDVVPLSNSRGREDPFVPYVAP